MLLESDNDSEAINFSKNSGSDVNYAWEEKWNETDEVVEEVKDDDVIARELHIEGMGCPTNFTQGTKNSIYLIVWASEKMLSVLEAFLLLLTNM
jgi:hypothetical protein